MAVDIKAFLTIEKALAKRLQLTWGRLAMEITAKVQAAIAQKDWATANAIANNLDLSPIYKENQQVIRYQSYAGLYYGATRLTPDPKKTSINSNEHEEVVQALSNQLKLMIEHSLTPMLQQQLLQLIANAEAGVPNEERGFSQPEVR